MALPREFAGLLIARPRVIKNNEEETMPLNVLREFLHCDYDSQTVFDKFLAVKKEGDVFHENKTYGKRRFWYRPATRKNAVLLVAHADVKTPIDMPENHVIVLETSEEFVNNNLIAPLGGDDRCGCALIYLFRNSGHGLLVTDGEERGLCGAHELVENCPEIFEEINRTCNFFIELDRRGDKHYKFYDQVPWAFSNYIEDQTGWLEDTGFGLTDISVICKEHPGVNLTVGYHEAHSTRERVVKSEWMNTVYLLQDWLSEKMLPRF